MDVNRVFRMIAVASSAHNPPSDPGWQIWEDPVMVTYVDRSGGFSKFSVAAGRAAVSDDDWLLLVAGIYAYYALADSVEDVSTPATRGLTFVCR